MIEAEELSDEQLFAEFSKRRLGHRALKERNIRIAQMLADGVSTSGIALKEKISTRTVEAALDEMRLCMDANSRPHLIAILMRNNKIK